MTNLTLMRPQSSGTAPAIRLSCSLRSPGSLLPALFAAAVATACVGHSYEVPRDEIDRLVSQPADQRGAMVRVVQRLMFADDPPRAPVAAGPEAGLPPPYSTAYAPRGMGFFLGVGLPIHPVPGPLFLHGGLAAPGYGHGYGGAYRSAGVAGSTDGVGAGAGTAAKAAGKAGGSVTDDARALAVLAVAAAATSFAVVAVTEASRFDGWASVNPWHPLHLHATDGSWSWVYLRELHPSHLRGVDAVVLRPDEAGGLRELARAPLNRVGWTWRMEVGSTEVPIARSRFASGSGFHMQVGAWVNRWTGVLVSSHLAWGTDSDAADFFQGRYTAELQWLPIQLWRFHLGGFAGAGLVSRSWESGVDDAGAHNGPVGEAGALFELDLNTRVSLVGRSAWTVELPDSDRSGEASFGWSVGLAVY